MTPFYYLLNPDHSVHECTYEEWSEQFEKMSKKGSRHLADEMINGKHVSTVWLGTNHDFSGTEKPILFETMVFDDDSIYCKRYSTWNEAMEGHKKAVEWVKNGCKDE